MNTPIYLRPLFRISHVKALENSRTIHGLMAAGDLADFTALDSSIDQPWLDDWVALINTADNIPTDEVYRDEMRIKTAAVQAEMKKARDAYKLAKFFVLKAFPENGEVQDSFGFDNYKNDRKSDVKMHQFIINLHQKATAHAAVLTAPAIGYPAAKIAELQTIANSLLAANTDQENHKTNQTVATRERITALNAVWSRRQLVAAAAKLIFEDNYAKYQQYLLPPSEANEEDFGIMGLVQDAQSNAPIMGATATIDELGLAVTSDENGMYGFADNIPPGDYTIRFNAEGYAEFTSTVTVTSADETITLNALMNEG